MAPLLPLLITLTLSFAGPVFANHFGSDGSSDDSSSSRFGRSYDSPSSDNSGYEAQQRQWAQESREAEQRNQAATERMKQGPTYSGPSWTNPTPSYGVYGPGNSMAVCTTSTSGVYCW